MSDKVKSTIVIKMGVHKVNIPFYITTDDQYYADEKVNQFFSKKLKESILKTTLYLTEDNSNIEIKAYTINQVIDNITYNTLKQLAHSGINSLIENGGDKVEEKEERVLSEFDKLILQAMNYNPREEEKK